MTVLRSFDLNGNKKSFANWISNLSPKDVPFTSMIGKEKIDQTQYSWQTDALAPAMSESVLEGEQFDAQPRAATQVITNFTSIIRREASVSDTAAKVATYGRNNEMEYQLRKAAAEVIRDIEFQNLSTQYGHPGSERFYSNQGGFKSLVATVNQPDPDTKAVVHTEIAWRKGKPAFTLKDIFNITSNLYLAGSKADKIMFHPAHVHIFSDMMGYNDEEPQVYRMFDNVDTKFNMAVCKVKDPLGRMYTLIPNRYMPQDHVYIFNESDWTQTVLRAPERIRIGKKGSSETMIIETEIGLRHRHPYASGVLGLVQTNLIAALKVNKRILTAYTGEEDGLLELILTKEEGGAREADHLINWESSDRNVIFLADGSEETDFQGYGSAKMIPGKPGDAAVRVTGTGIISTPIHIEVREPLINFALHDATAEEPGTLIHSTTTVNRHSGSFAANGTVVQWHASDPSVAFIVPETGAVGTQNTVQGGQGKAAMHIKPHLPGTFKVWTSVGGVLSKKITIYIGKSQLQMEWDENNPLLYVGKDANTEYAVIIRDKNGDPVGEKFRVDWRSSDYRIMSVNEAYSLTNADGIAKVHVSPHTHGNESLKAHCFGIDISTPVEVRSFNLVSSLHPAAMPFAGAPTADASIVKTSVIDSKGQPVKGATIYWSSSNSSLIEFTPSQTTTDDNGKAQSSIKTLTRGSGAVHTRLGTVDIHNSFTVGTGGDLTANVNPNPSRVNADVIFSGVVFDMYHNPVAGQKVTFTVTGGTGGGLIIPDATTSDSGIYSIKTIPTIEGNYTIIVKCDSVDAQKTIKHTVKAVRRVKVVPRAKRSIATPGISEAPIEMVVLVTEDSEDVNSSGAANLPISARDPSGAFIIDPPSGMTDAAGEWRTCLKVVGDVGDVADIEVSCDGQFGYQEMQIKEPVVKVEIDPSSVVKGQVFNATATVYSNDGVTKAGENVDVKWTVDPTDMDAFNQPEYKTDKFGKVVTSSPIGVAELYTFIASAGPYNSNQAELRLARPVIEMSLTPDTKVETGQPVTARVNLKRIDGTFISGQKINITTDPVVAVPSVTTDAYGNAIFTVIWPFITSDSEECGIHATMDADPSITTYGEVTVVSTGVAVKTEIARRVMSTKINDTTSFTVEVTDLKTNQPAEDIDVVVTSSKPEVFGVAGSRGKTGSDGKFTTNLMALTRGMGNVDVEVRGKTTQSESVMVDEPKVTLETNYTTIHEGESFEAVICARHANSNEFIVGHDATFRTDDDGATFTPSDKITTEVTGAAKVVIKPSKKGTIQVWTEIGEYTTEKKSVNVVDVSVAEVNASVDREEMIKGINDFVTLTVETRGVAVGTAIAVSSTGDVFTYDSAAGVVDATGLWTTKVHLKPGAAVGAKNLIVECNGETLNIDIMVATPKVRVWINPAVAIVGSKLKVVALVSDQNNSPLGKVFDVAFTASEHFVGVPATAKTGMNGIAHFEVDAPVQGNHTISATVGGVTSDPAVVNTGDIALTVTGDFDTPMKTGKYLEVEALAVIGGTASRDIEVWANSSSSSIVSVVAPSSGLTDTLGKFKFQLASTFTEGTADITFGVRETVSGVTKSVTKTITVSDAITFNMTATAKYPRSTVSIGQENEIEVRLTSSTAVVSNLPVSVSDPKGLFDFTPTSGPADANGVFKTTATIVGLVGEDTEIEVVCKDKTVKVPLSIQAPKITVDVTPNPAPEGAEITGTASVFLEDGVTPAGKNVDVTWDVDPATLPEFNHPSYQTNTQGKVILTDKLPSNSDFEFFASVEDAYHSNVVKLKVVDMEVTVTSPKSGPMTVNDGLGRNVIVNAKVGGDPVKGATLALTVNEPTRADLTLPLPSVTDDSGNYSFFIKPRGSLTDTLKVTAVVTHPVSGQKVTTVIPFQIKNPLLVVTPAKTDMAVGTEQNVEISLRTANNELPLAGKQLTLTCVPVTGGILPSPLTKTNAQGITVAKFKPTVSGVQKLKARYNAAESAEVQVNAQGLDVTFTATDNGPFTVDENDDREVTANVKVGGVPVADATVVVNIADGDAVMLDIDTPAKTDASGNVKFKLTAKKKVTPFTAEVVVTGPSGNTVTQVLNYEAKQPLLTIAPSASQMIINTELPIEVSLRTANGVYPLTGNRVTLTCNPTTGAILPDPLDAIGSDGKMTALLAPVAPGIHTLTTIYKGANATATVTVNNA